MDTHRTWALLALTMWGCATPGTLDRSLSRGEPWPEPIPVTEVPVCGYDLKIDLSTEGTEVVWGELLAVDGNSLIVLEYQGPFDQAPHRPRVVPTSAIARLELISIPDRGREVAAIWTVGLTSTATHGLWGAYLAPIWLVTAIYAQTESGRTTEIRMEGNPDPTQYHSWARYPGAVPPGLLEMELSYCPTSLSPSQQH